MATYLVAGILVITLVAHYLPVLKPGRMPERVWVEVVRLDPLIAGIALAALAQRIA